MFGISYFDNSGKRVCENELFCLFWVLPILADFPIETGAPYKGAPERVHQCQWENQQGLVVCLAPSISMTDYMRT